MLTNNTALAAFPHTVSAAFLTAGTFVAGISGWWMVRSSAAKRATPDQEPTVATMPDSDSAAMFRPAAASVSW